MSLFATPLISLFFFFGFAIAGLYAPDCSSTGWEWSFNSLGQNSCMVAAYMMSTCYGGSFTVDDLPQGYHYSGPYVSQGSDLCWCSTISYSLLSACDGCQGSDWISWSAFAYNCTTKLPPSSFPNPIPAGTRLPRWALLDVTTEKTWNANESFVVGDSPELGPGTILGTAGPSSSSSSSAGPRTINSPAYSSRPLASQTPVPSTSTKTTASQSYTSTVGDSSNTTTSGPVGYSVVGHSSNTGAIAGGTVGGIAAICIVIVALFFFRQRRRVLAQPAPSAGDGQASAYYQHVNQVPSRPMSGHEPVTSSLPGTSASLLRTYGDPSTFSGSQVAPNPSFISAQAPSLSNTRHLYTVATPPGPESQGHGG